jgi:3-oxoacyl-[acyl-carrier protein] reductase
MQEKAMQDKDGPAMSTETTELDDIDTNRLGPPPGSRMVVAGGCGGIGRGVVKAALDIGVEVIVMDLEVSNQRHPTPNGATFIAVDATDGESVAAAFEELKIHWDTIDSLVNLVGYANDAIPVTEVTSESFDDVIAGNVRSAFLFCQAAMPLLHASGSGSIINTSSGLGFRGMPGYGPYTASKAAVVGMTKAFAAENAPTVRANAIAPGAVDTAFLVGGTGRVEDEDTAGSRSDMAPILAMNPMKRLGVVDDIVAPILFLAGPASRWLSGQTLHLNGGGFTP